MAVGDRPPMPCPPRSPAQGRSPGPPWGPPASVAAVEYLSAGLVGCETDRWDHGSALGRHPGLPFRKGRWGGQGRRVPEQELRRPPCFPIRKHILLVSGCRGLAAICCSWLRPPTSSQKTASKTTISSLRSGGGGAVGGRTRAHTQTHTHTHFPAAGVLPSRTSYFTAEARGRVARGERRNGSRHS